MSDNRVLYIDPNPEGTNLINHEDLSIFVELNTTKKERSEINVDAEAKKLTLMTVVLKHQLNSLKVLTIAVLNLK